LDGDGKVDYIKVSEYGQSSNKGFSFVVETPSGEKQEIASVEIGQVNAQEGTMNISGNQAIYGSK